MTTVADIYSAINELIPLTQRKAGITAVYWQVIPIRALQKLSLPLISQTMLSKKQKRRERSL